MRYSIIVTFYNAENYILRTLNNLKKIVNEQTEIIIIDDGSTDNSLNIIKKFKLNNSKIITKKNGGVSSARNIGISNANGKYIMFLDGDDWLDEKLFNVLDKYYDKDYDLIKYGLVFTNLKNEQNFEIVSNNTIYNKKNIQNLINQLLSTSKFNSASNQIIKTDLIKKNNLLFKENIKFAEDFDFNLNLFANIKNSIVLKQCLYYYYINSNSTTHSCSKSNTIKCLQDALLIYVTSLTNYKKTPCNAIRYCDVLDRVYKEIVGCYKKSYLIENISTKEVNNIAKYIYKNKDYLLLKKELRNNKYFGKNLFDIFFLKEKIYCINYLILKFYKLFNQ